MGVDGKVVLKGSGRPPVEEDGSLVVFDGDGESCCCDSDSPVHCEITRWNLKAPEGAKYPHEVNSEYPTCVPITINGGAFAGTYELSAISPLGGSFSNKRTVIAAESVSVPVISPATGEPALWFPIWAGFEYEIDIKVTVQEFGLFPQSTNYIIIRHLGRRHVPEGNILEGETDVQTSALVLNYAGENWFDQRDAIKALVPVSPNAAYFQDWDVTIDFTYRPRSLRSLSANGCGCEWSHTRYINHPQLIKSGDDGWSRYQALTEGQIGGSGIIFEPLEATAFSFWDGWSVDPAGGTYSAIENDDGTFNPIDILKRAPWEIGNGFRWDFTLNTQAFARTSTSDPFKGFGGGIGTIDRNRAYHLSSVFGSVTINRRFEAAPSNFDPPNTGELVSYYIMAPYSALVHTQTAPTSEAILIPWDKVLPNTTAGYIQADFVRPLFVNINQAGGDVQKCKGFEFKVKIVINGITIEEYYREITEQALFGDLWADGEWWNTLYVNGQPHSVNAGDPTIFNQFAGGFDDACKNWYSGSMTILKDAYAAPEMCNRENPDIFLTPSGTKDLVAGTHEITFHVGEDIGTVAPPATTIHQAYVRNVGSMKMPMYITRSSGSGSPDRELPPGLSVTATGLMTGTPTTEGTWTIQHWFRDAEGFEKCSWPLKIIVKVRNPEFFYPSSFVSGGTNTSGADWYMRDGDSGTIESNLTFGTTPYAISYTGDALDGASFDAATGNWVLSPAHTQVGDTSGTVTMSVVDDTNKTDYVTYTWFREGGTPPI